MTVRKHYVPVFRRRREGKTDYSKRKGLVMGRKPLLTVRVSNKYVYGQVLQPTSKGDLTLCSSSSRILKKYGWKGSAKNIPSAFLSGYLLGTQALTKKINEAIAYPGVTRFVHGSRIASFLGGARAAGLRIPLDEAIIPDKVRMNGNHVAKYAAELESGDSKAYGRIFSGMISAGTSPKDYPKLFEHVKTAMEKHVEKK